jgi:hypothetical protein
MTWRTHVAVGLNALWIAPFISPIDKSILILIPLAAVASLLPDIDATGTGAKIHYIGKGFFGMFRGLFFWQILSPPRLDALSYYHAIIFCYPDYIFCQNKYRPPDCVRFGVHKSSNH